MTELTEQFQMAKAKKEAEINIWLYEQESSGRSVDMKIFLIGLASGVGENPDVLEQLTDEEKAFLPSASAGVDFAVSGIKTYTKFYTMKGTLDAYENAVLAGSMTNEQAIGLVEALVVE